MKRFVTYLLLIAMILSLVPSAMAVTVEADTTLAPVYEDSREKLNFNQGWKFYRGYISEAIETTYPQEELEKWENVNLPHSIRLEPYMNSHSTYQGDGMYIKHFLLDETYAGKKLYIEFEGIMGVTDVWVNGVHMETNIANRTGDQTSYCGYLPIIIDITDVAKCDGSENIIVVHCNNEDNNLVPPGKPQNSADMTYFGGIYRDAWLEVASPVHITNANFETIVAGGGILVDYPSVSQESADVFVQTHVRNESNKDETVTVKTTILDPNGQQAAVDTCQAISLPSGGDYSFTQTITVSNPALWSLDLPQRNTLVSEVYVGEQLVDRVETKIGIRKIEMDKSYGLKINGEVQDMLNGVNRHQEYAYVGFAASSSLQRSDAVKYKDAGFNVVRAAHYPMSNDFLDACDELGILVIEPTPGWQYYNSNPTFTNRVLDNTRAMVRRDRNHPCILAYETVLNETGNCPHEFTQLIATTAKEEHPSAKCATENSLVNGKDDIADIMYTDSDKSATAVSFTREYGDSYREQYGPSNFFDRRVMRGTGSYYPGGEGAMFKQAVKRLMGNQPDTPFFDPVDAASSSKGGASGSSRSFLANVERYHSEAGYIGCTMWIGIDHNRGYEDNMSPCGLWDLYRIPKFSYYAMASQRPVEHNEYLEARGVETGPMLFISSYWTEQAPVVDKSNEENKQIGTDESRIILVYSNAETVKLSVEKDGEVLYEQTLEPATRNNMDLLDHAPFEFLDVPYTSGSSLKAEGFDAEGNLIASQVVNTAGEPAKLRLETDLDGMEPVADGSDLLHLYAYVEDAQGNLCSTATNELTFEIIQGDGTIVGTGDSRVHSNPINAEAGIIGALLQTGTTAGPVTVRVSSPGLESAEIVVDVKPMTEAAVDYVEIPYTPGELDSPYVVDADYTLNKTENSNPNAKPSSVTFQGNTYRKSFLATHNSEITVPLEGKYTQFETTASVSDNNLADGKEYQFRVYVDGVLQYVTAPLGRNESEAIQVDVSGGQELKLVLVNLANDHTAMSDGNAALNYTAAWLNPYLRLGDYEIDESELIKNLAVGCTATASSSANDTDPSMAVDGNVDTVWFGDEVGTGEDAVPQTWQVDLGDTYDVKNAKVRVEFDSTGYTYEIWTSATGADDDWTKQVDGYKTAQGNEDLDKFEAKGVRYVKVVFTDVPGNPDRGQPANATLQEFEIYQDMGIDSVTEYNLKGFEIVGNTNLIFDPSTTEYTVPLMGFESKLYVKALAQDPNATITINGVPVENHADATMSTATTYELAELPENKIVVSVTSANGQATKTYTFHIQGQLGELTESNAYAAFIPGQNGANNWYMQERTSDGTFQTLQGSANICKLMAYCMTGSESWCRVGPKFMHPGNKADAVRTFVAPSNGTCQVLADAVKYNGQAGDVRFSILKNGTKVWPESGDYVTIHSGDATVHVDLQLEVQQGDQIQFVVNDAGSNASDGTALDTTVKYLQDAHTHTLTAVEAKDSTCTEKGNIPYWYCEECGKYFSDADATTEITKEETELPLAAHTEETVPGKPATCTEDGLTDGIICSVCHTVIKEQEAIPATGHHFENGVCTECGETAPDKTLLEKTVKYAEGLDTTGVTDAAKEAFETALDNAKAVLDNANATQDEINAAWDALLEGIWGLGLTQGDKDMLNLLMERAESMMDQADKYVEANWQQLVDALNAAKDVAVDGNAMQEDVAQAADNLLDAILAQRFKADKSILEDLIAKAENINLEGYTAESVAAFRFALAEAQVVLADSSLSEDDQATVDDAVAALSAAMDGLTAEGETQPSDKPEASDTPEASQKPEVTEKPEGEGPAQTGDSAQLMLYVAILAAAVCALSTVAVARKRRNS